MLLNIQEVLPFSLRTVSGNTLTLTAVTGNTACPGGDLVFNCTITSTTGNINIVNLRWRRAGASSPAVIYVYTSNELHNTHMFDGFTTNAHNIPPNTLTSTATLRGAQFSHNNYVLECYTLLMHIQPNLRTAAVAIEGILFICSEFYNCKFPLI